MYQWKQPKELTNEEKEQISIFASDLSIAGPLAELLWRRGIQTKADYEAWIHPKIEDLYDPFLFPDMAKAVARILFAIENNQRILIYGDYDCDGISSTVVLKDVLDAMGAEVEYFLPDRTTDGYGPNLSVYKYYIQSGIDLIITVDNGITGFEALAYAKEQGVDVIVTDHHQLKEELPEAYAIIHPLLPGTDYPEKHLAGVGVAFKLACALVDGIPTEVLDMVALGTIADLMPLTGENRTLVALGLDAMRHSERMGLQQLAHLANLSLETITSEQVSFQIAPRLNAPGRLGDANIAVEMLTTFDDEVAQQYAKEIDALNTERKEYVEKAVEEAKEQLTEDKIQIVTSTEWPEGILGIVAGKIMDQTGCPCLALHLDPLSGEAKGSARSVESLSIVSLLEQCSDLLVTFGGHPAAAGLTITIENLEAFRQKINQIPEVEAFEKGKKEQEIDLVLSVEDCTMDFFDELQILAPFGKGNPVPCLELQGVSIENPKTFGKNQAHMKGLIVQKEEEKINKLPFIYFSYRGSQRDLLSSAKVNVIGELDCNEWQGKQTLQLRLKDYEIPTLQLFDARGQRFLSEDYVRSDALYLYFNPLHKRRLQMYYPEATLLDVATYLTQKGDVTQVILLDIPTHLEELAQLIHKHKDQEYVLVAHDFEEAYLNGMPSREQFTYVFQYLKKQKDLDVHHQLKQLSQMLKIPMQNLIFMINLFRDLDFVRIQNGILNPVPNPTKRPLDSSTIYQERETLIQSEAFLLYETIDSLFHWFQQQEEEK